MTIKPGELTEAYTPVKLKEQSSGLFGDYYSGVSFQMDALGFGGANDRMRELFELLQISWVKDGNVQLFGQHFIVTYILEPSLVVMRRVAEGGPLSNPVLKLKLMKADQIGSIEPFPDVTRESYVAALAKFDAEGSPVHSPAQATASLSNAKQLAVGLLIYMADYDDILPYVNSTATVKEVVRPYLKNDAIWKTNNPSRPGEFRFNMALSGVNSVTIENPAAVPLVFDPHPFPDGRYTVAFADGHAKRVSEQEWRDLQPMFKLKLKRHGKPIDRVTSRRG